MKIFIDDFIRNHTYINYCEALIFPDGTIDYAIPSHVLMLMKETHEDEDVIWRKMPITDSPIIWLTEYTKCIALWSNGYVLPLEYSDEQKTSLNKLIKVGLVAPKSIFE